MLCLQPHVYRNHMFIRRNLTHFRRVIDQTNGRSVSEKMYTAKTKRDVLRSKGKKLPNPANITFHVLGSGSTCSARSLLIDFRTHRYIFNCSEGTQRVIGDRKKKIGRVENFFITKLQWKNVSGLSGAHLSINGNSAISLKVCGPKSIPMLMQLTGSTNDHITAKLDFTGPEDGSLVDEVMAVDIIEILSTRAHDEGNLASSPAGGAETEPTTKRARLEVDDEYSSVAYLCQTHPRPGRVSKERILELDIPRDKTISELVSGKTVILPDGREIKPTDIMSGNKEEQPFFVVECADSSYLPALHNCSKLQQYYADVECKAKGQSEHPQDTDQSGAAQQSETSADEEKPSKQRGVNIVVHFTPVRVASQQAYQDWMKRFGSETKHLMLNEWASGFTLEKCYQKQTCHNLLHPTIFPLLKQQLHQEECLEEAPIDVENVTIGQPGLMYNFRGAADSLNKFDSTWCYKILNEQLIEDIMTEDLQKEIDSLHKKLDNLTDKDILDDRHYPEIVFLGTGSSWPAPLRNVSGIMVHLNSDSCMLLDVGEGTTGQIRRFYGDQADDMFCQLKAVFISHKHADHHMGLLSVLIEREKVLLERGLPTPPLVVIVTHTFKSFFKKLNQIVHTNLEDNITFVYTEDLYKELSTSSFKIMADLEDIDFPFTSIKVCRVLHRKDPFGLILTLENSFKLVYSGDTMPCPELIKEGKGCDLLIHEATLEDALEEDAIHKRHSTTSQAISVGRDMEAKFTILTHFSQRYAHMPLVNDNFHHRVGVAFDFMKVCPREFHILPLLLPALSVMWKEYLDELVETQNQRKRRAERNELLNSLSETKQEEGETPNQNEAQAVGSKS